MVTVGQKIKVVNGPSFWDLHLGLFDNNPWVRNSRRYTRFGVNGLHCFEGTAFELDVPVVDVCIYGASMNPRFKSGHVWNIQGIILMAETTDNPKEPREIYHAVSIIFNTRDRTGELTVVDGPADTFREAWPLE